MENDLRAAFQAGWNAKEPTYDGGWKTTQTFEEWYAKNNKSNSFNWDDFAKALKNELGESLVEEEGGEEDPYNWWLCDVTVTDIIDFIKKYKSQSK